MCSAVVGGVDRFERQLVCAGGPKPRPEAADLGAAYRNIRLALDADAVACVLIGPSVFGRASKDGAGGELNFDVRGDDVNNAVVVLVFDYSAGGDDDAARLGYRDVVRCDADIRYRPGLYCQSN